jgi:hypothetical protein
MIKIAFILLPFFTALVATAQNKTIVSKESQEDILNPERGFYIPSGTRASNFVVLDAEKLRTYRNTLQRSSKATYTVKVSLIYRGYELDTFKSAIISRFFNQSAKRF